MIKTAIITIPNFCVVITYEDKLSDSDCDYVEFRTVTIRKTINLDSRKMLYLIGAKINNDSNHVYLYAGILDYGYSNKTLIIRENDAFNSVLVPFEMWKIEYVEFEDEASLTLFMETL